MQKRLFFFLMMLFYGSGTVAQASLPVATQGSGQAIVPTTDGCIREWLVIGPFFPNDLDRDFLSDVGGEANIEPKAGDSVATLDGTILTWKRYKPQRQFVHLGVAIGAYQHATGYAFCVIQSEIAGNAQFFFGNNAPVMVWINGEQVYSNFHGASHTGSMFEANLEEGPNRCAVKLAQKSPGKWTFAMRVFTPNIAVISGTITDGKGNRVFDASVRLEQNGGEIARMLTDEDGNYCLGAYPVSGLYDVSATAGELGEWQLGVPLHEGERRTLGLMLKKAISIEGTLLMPDNKTPHVAVPVQAIRNGRVAAGALSDKAGKYRLINLRPGKYQVRCQVLGGYVYYGKEKEQPESRKAGRPENGTMISEPISIRVEIGRIHKNIDFFLAPFKKGNWRNYDQTAGLAHPAVKSIYCAPDGALWFGTGAYPIGGSGVSRYDGREFTNFTTEDGLADNWVLAIHGTPDGTIWFGTDNGISRYDGREFVNFTIEDGLADNKVNAILCADDGITWFGTKGGVSRYDGTQFHKPLTVEDGLIHKNVTALYRDPDGVMWFGTEGGGVSRYDGKTFADLEVGNGLTYDITSAICRDSDGVLWFGTTQCLSRYDGEALVNLTEKHGLVHNNVRAIYCDPDGIMWFGTAGGVSRYDGKTFVNFVTEDGLIHNAVTAIRGTADGALWFGTSGGWMGGGGVSRYVPPHFPLDKGKSKGGFANFTTEDGLAHNRILDIHFAKDGVMWIGTQDGVFRYDGKQFFSFPTPKGGIRSVHSDPSDMIWIGTLNGGFRYNGTRFARFIDGNIMHTYRAPDGAMWVGAWSGGLYRYHGEESVHFTEEKDGLASNFLPAGDIIDSDSHGMLWIGTWWGGVSRYDGTKFYEPLTEKDGLVDNRVAAVHCAGDGAVWFGTMNGLSRYDGKEFVSFTSKDGLASNEVRAIHFDPDGIMWFGTSGGVSLYDGTAWSVINARDGLAGSYVVSIQPDSEGFLWFGTEGGLTRYKRNTTPPRVHIVSVTADQTYRDLSAVPAFKVGTRLTIEYDAIDLKTLPERRQYRCCICEARGNENAPSPPHSPTYLPPTKRATFDWVPRESGAYIFQVQAIDRDLNYSEPASLEITISAPPFYTHAGFISGSILAAFLIPTAIYALLLTRQKKQAFEPVPNPYIVGNPIRSKEMFFGRRSDFEFVRIKLGSEQAGMVIVFAGERRSGKTSILFQILNGELGERCVPVLLDMQAMTVDSDAEFFEKMASEINEALVGQVPGPAPTVTDFSRGNPTRAFERFMTQIMEALGGKVLLLLIDEYELIEAKIDDGVLRPDLITFFASLLEAHPRLSFIFTGSRHLEQRNPEYWHILIGKSLYRPISFLSQRDALRLITEPVKEQVVYPRGIPERILRLTAGQPFYTQVVCQNLMDRLNEVQRNRVRQVDVDAVAQELADNPLPQMIYFWDGLRPEQQRALSLLGEVLEDSNRYAPVKTLLSFAQEQNLGLEFELSELEHILDELFAREMLERERAGEGQYEYRFRADLFRLWVRQAHSVWEQRA